MSPSTVRLRACRAALLVLMLGAGMPLARAGLTDISPEPVISQLSGKTKPNLMFILDDSGSMSRAYMPDELRLSGESESDAQKRYGYWARQCNGVAYDPSISYRPPVKADGTSYANASYPKALVDGYDSGSGTEDLSRHDYYVYTGTQERLAWAYDANGQPNTSTTFYKECMSTIGKDPGVKVFSKVDVNRLATDLEKVNYANWFSYYRKRYLMMRTAVGIAMQKLDADSRVGFSRLNATGHTDGIDFRDARPFDAAQKANFYASLYGTFPGGGTPLRGALSKVGRYYAKRLSGQTYDPVEYACQRNYALLTTDGYWNNGGGIENGTSYGPLDLFGKAVGQQDGNESRPMKDVFNTKDTLADVAQYYYAADLRTPALGNCASKDEFGVTTDVCNNIVPVFGRDSNTAQHMTTFGISFGVSGTLRFDSAYLNGTTADYSNIVAGTKDWPATTTALSGSSGDARNIDDLWHAAVNGRGQYYSARDASSLSDAIVGVSATIKDGAGAAAAASFNTLAFVTGNNNRIYQATYTSHSWTGELQAFSVDGDSGNVSSELWSAGSQLDARPASGRKIVYRQAPANPTLRDFVPANLSTDGYLSHFANLCSKPVVASQCADMPGDRLTKANDSTNLVNYLRGDRRFETTNPADPLYRARKHVLGDIIHGAPVFVGKPPFGYTDAGYAAFVTAQATRKEMVYAGANDGMLHAFDALTGQEQWAYMPSAVMANLYKLADVSYPTRHSYSVDGEPVIGDILVGGVWKTILVGGLGSGGRAYYALDITDPLNPKSLWEFTDSNLGLSYSTPIITKRVDGTWIVAFTSGLNNVSPGDGLGRLFVLNADTGAKLLDIPTSAGSTGTPSGLMRLNAWVEKSSDNTVLRFYAGDVLGNLWRFDIDNLVQPFRQAQLIARFQTPSGGQQPVTTRPELLTISENGIDHPVVVVGTGRYLGSSDIGDKTVQSIYAVKDPMAASGWGNARAHPDIVRTNVSVSGAVASATNVAVNWGANVGWYLDLPTSGERVVTPMSVLSSTLTVGSTIPGSSVCSQGGSSWFYRINMKTGLANPNTPFGELFSSDSVIIGLTGAKLADGTSALYVKDSTGAMRKYKEGIGGAPGTKDPRRSSWRELID